MTLVGVGQGCDLTPLEADTEYCNSENLACDRCPGETGAKQCQELNGEQNTGCAPSVTVTVITAVNYMYNTCTCDLYTSTHIEIYTFFGKDV